MVNSTNTLSGKIILVAEDQYLIADAIVASIESAGGEVLGPFASTQEALTCLFDCERKPHAAALNVNLVDGASFPLADELARRGLPFVFATGNDDELPDRFAGSLFLVKPYSAFSIVKVLALLAMND